jgi:hypothetical protein
MKPSINIVPDNGSGSPIPSRIYAIYDPEQEPDTIHESLLGNAIRELLPPKDNFHVWLSHAYTLWCEGTNRSILPSCEGHAYFTLSWQGDSVYNKERVINAVENAVLKVNQEWNNWGSVHVLLITRV